MACRKYYDGLCMGGNCDRCNDNYPDYPKEIQRANTLIALGMIALGLMFMFLMVLVLA